jgi:pimeloyl-ACP methyl ester carboxylesterase
VEPSTDADGRGLVVLPPGPWASWIAALDEDGYDSVVLTPAEDVVAAVGAAVVSGRTPVLFGHGDGARLAYALNGRAPLAAVVALAPTRGWRRPGTITTRAPLLLVSGGRDRVAGERHVAALARRDRRRFPEAVTDHHIFPGRDHDLAFGAGWRDVAGFCLDWLARQNL